MTEHTTTVDPSLDLPSLVGQSVQRVHTERIANHLAEYEVDHHDPLDDPHLVHTTCGETICTIEHEDSLSLLALTALTHRCATEGA